MTLTVVIPVRNERECLPSLFEKFERAFAGYQGPFQILLVDGASTDGTPETAETYADRLPVEVLRLRENIGLGGALEVGLLRALADSDVVVTMDGDDSHDPATIFQLLEKLREGYDVVVASRFEPGGAEIGVAGYRRLLSHTASAILRRLYPVGGIKDYSSGFRAYRTSALRRVQQEFGRLVNERGFSCMMELLLKLRAVGVRAAEVPLVLRYDLKHSESKMDVGRTVVRYLVVMARHLPRAGKWGLSAEPAA